MLTGVMAFLLLLITLLAIPLTLIVQVSWQQAFQGDIKLHWAFGLIRVRLPLFQSKPPPAQGNEPAQKIRQQKASPGKAFNPLAAFRQKSFRRRIIRFMRALWHAFHRRDISLRIRLGLGDPADTGQLWAIVGPVSGILANIQEASITIEPEFFDATFELDSYGSIRFIPLQMIYLTVGLLLSPAVWRGIIQMRKVG
jgi:hypothetical protein